MAPSNEIDLGTYEKEYPKSLFNKGVRAKNEDDVGHVMKETDDKIVVFGQSNYRFDIPKFHIIAAGRNAGYLAEWSFILAMHYIPMLYKFFFISFQFTSPV